MKKLLRDREGGGRVVKRGFLLERGAGQVIQIALSVFLQKSMFSLLLDFFFLFFVW